MGILILAILILINGFFALSEIALVSSKEVRLRQLLQEGHKGAKEVLMLKESSENYLSAIQVGITLIGIVMGVFGGVRLAGEVQPLFEMISFTKSLAYEIALVVTVFLITYVSIVIGELVPKTIALSNPEKVAVRIAPLILVFSKAFYPFVKLLSVSTSLINRLLGIEKKSERVTEAELRQMLKVASSQGEIEQEQNIIHEKVFYLSDKRAWHLMTHRGEVEWLDLNSSEQEIKEAVVKSKHSKLLCCRGSLDHYAGFLHLKDYYMALLSGDERNPEQLLIKPFVIKADTSAQDILETFKKEKNFVCVVMDNKNKLAGIITLHDMLEHIVGLVPNEGEDFEPEIFVRDNETILVNGEAPVETLSDLIEGFNIDFEKVEYSSVAGFVYFQLNKQPELGARVQLPGYEIEVTELHDDRINKVLIRKTG